MTLVDSTILTSEVAEAVRGKLQNAPAPLKLADVVKGLPKPRKTKAADFQNAIQPILDEQVRLGQAFRCPSGKNGETRYWSRDEKHLLREKALELASTPLSLAALKKSLKSEVKGVEASFLQLLIEELIDQNQLFEHPTPTARGGPLFGATPPPPAPPPLERPKHAKALNKLIADCRKLAAAANVSVDELLQTLRTNLAPSSVAAPETAVVEPERFQPTPAEPMLPLSRPETTQPSEAIQPALPELEELILKALAHAPVHSLAELRAGMPAEYRGTAFDEAVLRLADEQQVILSQDALPDRFSEDEKAEFVRDGNALFTTIAKWS